MTRIANNIAPFVIPEQLDVKTWQRGMSICRIAVGQISSELQDTIEDEAFVDLILHSIDLADRSFRYANGEKVVQTNTLIKIMALIGNNQRIDA